MGFSACSFPRLPLWIRSNGPTRRTFQNCRSKSVHVDDSLSECLRSLLRQIVPNAASDDPVFVLTRKKLSIGRVVRIMRSTIGITFKGDRRNGDYGIFG